MQPVRKTGPEDWPSPPSEWLQPTSLREIWGTAAQDWVVMVLAWWFMGVLDAWAYPLLAVVVATRLHSLAVLTHELCHQWPAAPGMQRRLLAMVVAWPVANTVEAMQFHHLKHHKDSRLPTDPYQQPDLRGRPVAFMVHVLCFSMLVPVWLFRCICGVCSLVFPPCVGLYRKVLLEQPPQEPASQERLRAMAKEEVWLLLGWIPLMGWAGWNPWAFLWGLGVPLLLAGMMGGMRLLHEHVYVEVEDRRLDSVLKSTRDHHVHGLSKLILSPRNVGYHLTHHLHPRAGFRHLPNLHAFYRDAQGQRYLAAEEATAP